MSSVEHHQELFTDSVSTVLVDYGAYDGIPLQPVFSDAPDYRPPKWFLDLHGLAEQSTADESAQRGADLTRRLGPFLDVITPDPKRAN